MRLPREYETPLLLGLACAVLGLAVTLQWWLKDREQAAVLAAISEAGNAAGASQAAEASAAGKVFELPSQAHFNTIVERPLFIQGRRPLPPQEDAAPEPEKPLEIQLHGVVSHPDGSVLALFKNKAGHNYRLRANESVDGWTLVEIAPGHVVMQHEDNRQTLQLQKPKPKEAPKAEKPAEPAQEEGNDEEASDDNRIPRPPMNKKR